jgi:PAS domain-containing protein
VTLPPLAPDGLSLETIVPPIVLIAAEADEVRAAVARALRAYGVRQLEASPRVRAVQTAARVIPDVILVVADQLLNEPATLISELRASATTRDTPIVVRLAAGARATSDTLMMAGADRVLADGPESAALAGAVFRLSEITSQRRAIREIRRNLAALARPTLVQVGSAIQESKTAMIAADSSGRIMAINDRFVAATGFSRDEVIGQPIWDFLQAGSGRDLQANWTAFLLVGALQGGCLLRRKHTSAGPVEVHLASEIVKNCHVAAVVSSVR